MKEITIFLGSDHAGFELKEYVMTTLEKKGYKVVDMGTYSKDQSADYPDYAEKVGLAVKNKKGAMGILACSTGIGISIAANKISEIRAALVTDEETAQLSREHNDANVLVLAGKSFQKREVKKILDIWLTTKFEGGRHKKRIDKILKMEERYFKTFY